MSNLIKLNTQPTDQYDWNLIEDHNNRAVAKSTVSTYITQWSALRQQADKLIETNTLALSKCVYTPKGTLPHGEFTSVCQQALKLNHDKQGALAAVGRALMNGDVPEEALKLLNQMEPRAAAKFLKADEETKNHYVVHFEDTGRVPSQRDFQAPKVDKTKHRHVTTFEETGRIPSKRDFQPAQGEETKKDYVVHFESHEVQSNDRPNHQNELLSQVQQQDVVDVVVSQQPQSISQELEQIYLAFEQVVLKRHREIKESVEAINQVKALVSLVKSYRLVGE